MTRTIALIFAGGALGAVLREVFMLGTPKLLDGFPLDILFANLLASFLLGWVSGRHRRKALSADLDTLLGTGVSGGLSTFSSFAYGAAVLISASTVSAAVAVSYLLVSLVLGYAAIAAGLAVGGRQPRGG